VNPALHPVHELSGNAAAALMMHLALCHDQRPLLRKNNFSVQVCASCCKEILWERPKLLVI
jgi:hypothetical protein